MKIKPALIIMLFLYLAAGIAACAILFRTDMQPAVSDTTTQSAGNEAPVSASDMQETEAQSGQSESSGQSELSESSESSGQQELPLTEEASAESGAVPSEQYEPKYNYTAIHKSKKLFIRSEASMNAKIIDYLKPGESGEVIDIGETWVLIKHGNTEGYVFKEFLDIEELPQSADPQGL